MPRLSASLRATLRQGVLLVLAGSVGAVVTDAAGAYGHMPDRWAEHATVCRPTQSTGDTLCDVVGVAQFVPTSGSIQGRETYLYLTADSAMALLAPMNTEVAGGHHKLIRSPGGHVSGPGEVDDWWAYGDQVAVTDPRARIHRFHGLGFRRPPNTDEAYGLDFTDRTLPHRLAGELQIGDVLRFSNGWSFRTNANGIDLLDQNGIVRQFR